MDKNGKTSRFGEKSSGNERKTSRLYKKTSQIEGKTSRIREKSSQSRNQLMKCIANPVIISPKNKKRRCRTGG